MTLIYKINTDISFCQQLKIFIDNQKIIFLSYYERKSLANYMSYTLKIKFKLYNIILLYR